MSKTEWGAKRRCAKCDAPFYDMLRYPILCPKCGATFRPDAPIARRAAAKKAPAKPRTARVPPKSALPTVDSAPEDIGAPTYKASDAETGLEEIDRDEDDVDADDDDDEIDDVDDDAPEEPEPAPRAR